MFVLARGIFGLNIGIKVFHLCSLRAFLMRNIGQVITYMTNRRQFFR